MLQLIVTGDTTYSLDDGSIARLIAYDGWGAAPLHRIIDRGSLQHGGTDRGYRLDPRIGTLVFQLESKTLSDMYNKRSSLLKRFQTSNDLALKWTLDNGDVRQIDVHYYGEMSMPWVADEYASQRLAIQLLAPDPNFYDPTQQVHNFSYNFATGSVNSTENVTYLGTFLSYPIVKMTGPLTNPVLTNELTGDKLDFTGTTISGGTYYLIDCSYGAKTVVDNLGANKIDKLTDDSDLATFSLIPGPTGSKLNTIRLFASSTTGSSDVEFTYYRRYWGL